VRLFRWTLIALVVVDLATGLLMFVSPPLFGALGNVPVQDVPMMRGYGERILLLGLVYLWLLFNLDRAGGLRWIPIVDEGLNAGQDAYELAVGSMAPEVVAPMLVVHTAFAALLAAGAVRLTDRRRGHGALRIGHGSGPRLR